MRSPAIASGCTPVPGNAKEVVLLIKVAITLAVLYHVLATVVVVAGVLLMLRTTLGIEHHGRFPRRMHGWGERHLWLSGALIIGLGVLQYGLAYLDNPKLWTKLTVVGVWGLNSWLIKRRIHRSTPRERALLLGVSGAALLYGTFLGVAKSLSGGVMPFGVFLAAYCVVTALCVLLLLRHFDRMKSNAATPTGPARPTKEIPPMSAASP